MSGPARALASWIAALSVHVPEVARQRPSPAVASPSSAVESTTNVAAPAEPASRTAASAQRDALTSMSPFYVVWFGRTDGAPCGAIPASGEAVGCPHDLDASPDRR